MKHIYLMYYKVVLFVCGVVLFLQSCINSSNFVISEPKEMKDNIPSSNKQVIIEQLVGEKVRIEGGHVVTFYQEKGQLKANVIENIFKEHQNIPVYVREDVDLAQIIQLHKQQHEHLVPIKLIKIGQLRHVYVGRQGLLGGMMEGEQTLEELINQAEQGVANAQYLLGVRYQTGQGAEQDYQKALKWYIKAAEQGHASALNNLGSMYHHGQWVEQDYFKAFNYYTQAASLGVTTAQFNLGILYYLGNGVGQDYNQAIEWFRQAAAIGDANSQHMLGLMYASGVVIEQDNKKAIEWFQQAASQGHAEAIRWLSGLEGVGKEKKKKEKEEQPNNDLEDYQCLLDFAIKGDPEAQFQMGQRAYNSWRQQPTEGAKNEARDWLDRAAAQAHATAIALLEQLNETSCPTTQMALPSLTDIPTNVESKILSRGQKDRSREEGYEDEEEYEDIELTIMDLPHEMLAHILFYLGNRDILTFGTVNNYFSRLITGYAEFRLGIYGVENEPTSLMITNRLKIREFVDFNIDKLKNKTFETIPSFFLYGLLRKVKNLPREFWPYLKGTKIKRINLTHNHINDEGARCLAQNLRGTNVYKVKLNRNDIGDMGASDFAQNLQGTEVHEVNLAYNDIGDSGVRDFAQHLQGTEVYKVNLSCNDISHIGAKDFAQYLQGTKVGIVNLSINNVEDEGARNFAQYLRGTNIHTVNLSSNQIEAEGARDFVQQLQGTAVHMVDLSYNQIGDVGARDFAQHLQGTNVHTVNLANNQIGDAGVRDFAQYLQGTNVHTINLANNQIGDIGARDFAQAVIDTKNTTLRKVIFGDSISMETKRFLEENYVHIEWIFE